MKKDHVFELFNVWDNTVSLLPHLWTGSLSQLT